MLCHFRVVMSNYEICQLTQSIDTKIFGGVMKCAKAQMAAGRTHNNAARFDGLPHDRLTRPGSPDPLDPAR